MGDATFAPYLAEFVGTALLVFTVGCNVLEGSESWSVTSIASVLMVSVYALGGVSGAHLNPAVTFGAVVAKKMEDMHQAGLFVAAQLAGGAFAAGAYSALFGRSFSLAPGDGFSWWQAALVEFLYTFMLVLVVLNTACCRLKGNNAHNQYFGLAIGYVIVAGGHAGGWISGGAFNPAVAFAIDASSIRQGFGWCIVYTLFELAGAAAAAAIFGVIHGEEKTVVDIEAKLERGLVQNLLCEAIGTYFLILTVCLTVASGQGTAGWAIAASLMCMIFALGPVSGGHFNPAVTLSLLLTGRSVFPELKDAVMYMGAQVLGGLLAAVTAHVITGDTLVLEAGAGYNRAQAAAIEAVYTFVLCFVVLCCCTTTSSPKLSQYFGFAIGMCVVVGGYAGGKISGGALNPAVAVSIDLLHLVKGGLPFGVCLLYTAAEFVGAAAAAGAYKVSHPSEYADRLANAREKQAQALEA